jgi:hypothetical protein
MPTTPETIPTTRPTSSIIQIMNSLLQGWPGYGLAEHFQAIAFQGVKKCGSETGKE